MKSSYSISPIVDAEIAYRQERIAHDFAVTHGWELSVRRLFGRRRRRAEKALTPRSSTTVVTSDRLGWR